MGGVLTAVWSYSLLRDRSNTKSPTFVQQNDEESHVVQEWRESAKILPEGEAKHPADGNKRLIAEEQKIIKDRIIYKDYDAQVKDLKFSDLPSFPEIAEIRHKIALAKVPWVVSHLKGIIDSGEKVVCFAWHRDVIKQISRI